MVLDVLKSAEKALADEVFSAMLYERIAMLYDKNTIKQKLIEMAAMEREHAKFWRTFLEKRGRSSPSVKISKIKLFFYTVILKIFGLGLMLRMLESGERDAIRLYSEMLEHSELDEHEKDELRRILEDELIHEEEFVKEESKFKGFLMHVRDAVLGMNDGLVEILSVTTGLAGAYGNPFYIAIGGLIVGAAGALSMGIGALASVRAQRQVHESTLMRIAAASRYVAHVFKSRLIGCMTRKGYSRTVSEAVAEESSKDPKLLARVIAEEEYGLREEALENPLRAGAYTGMFYAVGAFVPLIPYFLGLPVVIAVILSLLLAGVALGATGFMIAISADLPVKRKMLEMIAFGLGSAGVTYVIGRIVSILFGIEVS